MSERSPYLDDMDTMLKVAGELADRGHTSTLAQPTPQVTQESPEGGWYDNVAERMLLGTCFADPTLVLLAEVEPEDFEGPAARQIWRVMTELADRGATPDEYAVMATIEGQQLEIDMLSLISSCWCPGAANLGEWVGRMHDARERRELALALDDAKLQLAAGQGAASVDDVLEGVEALRARARGVESLTGDQLFDLALDDFNEARRRYQLGETVIRGVPSGIAALDRETGGWPLGPLAILAARPARGKTTALYNTVRNSAEVGVHVLYLSNEDKTRALGSMALARESGIDRGLITHGKVGTMEEPRLRQAAAAAKQWGGRLRIVYCHGWQMARIVRVARALIRRDGVQLVAIDYVQNIPSPPKSENRNQGLEAALSQLEQLIAVENVACVVGCQINRTGEDKPSKRDLKDSGSLEQKAKLVVALHETAKQRASNLVDLIILKQNEGREMTLSNVPFNRATASIGVESEVVQPDLIPSVYS